MGLRVSFFALVAFLVFEQAKLKAQSDGTDGGSSGTTLRIKPQPAKAEASLRRTERLAALGQLTAGLAHELRNPLGTIRASAEMLNKDDARNRPEVMTEMSNYIRSEVDRMNGLITSFLDFARPLQIHPVEANLRSLVNQVFREQHALAERRGVMPWSLHCRKDDLRIYFRSGPAAAGTLQSAAECHSGQRVRADREVRLADGAAGWVKISVTMPALVSIRSIWKISSTLSSRLNPKAWAWVSRLCRK